MAPSTPTKTNHHWATRDQRLIARALREEGYSYAAIASKTNLTYRQVQLACQAGRPSPKKPPGQRRKLSEERLDEIIEFITASKEGRRMTYDQLIEALQLLVSRETLRKALARRRYHRCKALRKPPISERTRELRLTFAQEHVNWTREQWQKVLWTDETWVTSTYHRRIYVTRRAGEEFEDNCLRERLPGNSGG